MNTSNISNPDMKAAISNELVRLFKEAGVSDGYFLGDILSWELNTDENFLASLKAYSLHFPASNEKSPV